MIEPSSTVVIVNPRAAGGRVGRRWAEHVRLLRDRLGACAFRLTDAPGRATALAAEAVREGARTVVSMGGDGTHNEVLNGLLDAGAPRDGVQMGVLPGGTGGDFCRLLAGGHDLDAAARALLSSAPVAIDAGLCAYRADDGESRSRYFLNVASVGVGGLVDRIVNASRKRLGGALTFLLATLRVMRRYRPARLRIAVDGEVVEESEVALVATCNGRFAGGGMMFAPEARLADGALDVVVIRYAPPLRSLPVTAALRRGTHTRHPLVSCYRGRVLRLEPIAQPASAYVDLDGEAPGFAPAELRVVPGAVRMLGWRPVVAGLG
jgi:YegS/Rv2252/BmrU family lipid kinase